MGIPCKCGQVNVKTLTKNGSIEEIARNVRLNFLFGVAKEIKADKIALGHTQDDQAETVLMRILRGSGLYGLCGIIPKRKINGLTVIRPLIEVPRRKIEKYLKIRRIKPRLDYTNLEDIYFRNRIRNKLLPLLEKEYNPNIKEILANMAESSGVDYAYLLHLSRRVFSRSAKSAGKNRINLKLDKFLKSDLALQRMVLRHCITLVKGNLRRLAFKHIKEIEDLVLNRPDNSVVNLPKGVSVVKKRKYLSFFNKSQ